MEFNRLFSTIDAHTGGEPLRIITGGLPNIRGRSILEMRAYFREHFDDIRRVLMYEPRGHHGMYGCIVTPPVREEADFGVLFMHNEGFSTMCGHGIIAVVTALMETGRLPVKESVEIDSPAGAITAYAKVEDGRVQSVAFDNVPSFVLAAEVPVTVGGRTVSVDVAFGGAFYAFVDVSDLGDVRVENEYIPLLQQYAGEIKASVEAQVNVTHPEEPELHGIYGVIFSDAPTKPDSHLRNVTVFADAQIDRSPCGTGTAARLATLHRRGQLDVGQDFVHESIVGSQFVGRILGTTRVGRYDAVLPRISGNAHITGFHQFVVDPSDPLKDGFLLR